MNQSTQACILFTFVSGLLSFSSASELVRAITESEATALVRAQEEAKERIKDEREAELLSAEITETAVADLGDKKVIFNRVKVKQAVQEPVELIERVNANTLPSESDFYAPDPRIHINVTLSGTVYDGAVSELWWYPDGELRRVFTNANFQHFSGIGEFADDEALYSLFMLVTAQSTEGETLPEEWRPTGADFSADAFEYYIMDWGSGEEPNLDDCKVIDATLRYYAEHYESMRIRFDNRQKLSAARRAYLQSNPPKVRDVIVNYRPFEAEPVRSED